MDIVLFSFDKLQGRVGRAHHFARELSRRHRVIFIDRPASFLACRRLRTTAQTVEGCMVHVQLGGGLSGRRWRGIHAINEVRWLAGLGKILHERNWGSQGTRVCLHMLPVWELATDVLQPDVTVYDAHDDWRTMARNPRRLTERLEASHAGSADILLSASAATAANFTRLGKHTHSLANACDPQHFARAMTAEPARDLADIRQPRVMFIGGVEESFDTQAVLHVARAMPDVSFVIIGPEIRPQRELRGEANVYFLGERPYDELPSYLAGADVCWIPYRMTERVMGRDCVKLYEYLASGRPVVSVPLPRAVELGEHIRLSDGTAEGLVAACRAALADDNVAAREGRRAEARRHTWASRAAELEGLIEEFLSGKVGAGDASGQRGGEHADGGAGDIAGATDDG